MESVLIIDDDNSIVHILKDILEAHFEELCISVATSGKEGIEKIGRENPSWSSSITCCPIAMVSRCSGASIGWTRRQWS